MDGFAFLRKNYKLALLFAFVLLGSSIMGLKLLVVLPLLALVASFSTFYFNYVAVPVNFELVKLSTVLVAMAYGPVPGIALGIASTFFGKVLIGRIDEKLPISMAAISALALAASFLPGSVTFVGIALVACYNVLMFSLSLFMGGDLAWNLPYEVSNFIINAFLFVKVAPFLYQVIA